LQKELSNWQIIVKKMGSRQKAVKAFLAVCDNHAASMDPRRAHFLDEQAQEAFDDEIN
jgi:hypothetical protein